MNFLKSQICVFRLIKISNLNWAALSHATKNPRIQSWWEKETTVNEEKSNDVAKAFNLVLRNLLTLKKYTFIKLTKPHVTNSEENIIINYQNSQIS